VERVLFAATKADHLHQSQHPALTQIMGALVRSARSKAEYQGAVTEAMAIASLRATTEETRKHEGESLDLVRGRSLETGQQVAMYPGTLPDDPSVLLKPAEAAQQGWLDGEYAVMGFAPAEIASKPGEGPPHIRLDHAVEFLIGDRLG
jgi:predicted YcjX-like family ATPase